MFDRIVVDANICNGKPFIKGKRITVDFILRLFGSGLSMEGIIQNYPSLEPEDISQAANYGAWLATETTIKLA